MATQITLQPDEAALLKEVLTNYLADLRGEIGDTDNYDLRQKLKRIEGMLNSLVAQLG